MTKKKPGRSLDSCWNYVVKIENGFRCNACQKEFTGGATRIKAHLFGGGDGGISLCTKFVRPNAAAGNSVAAAVTTTTSNVGSRLRSSSSRTPPSLAPSSTCSKESIDEVHKSLRKYFIASNVSLETIKKPCFHNLVSSIAGLEHRCELPPNFSGLVVENLQKEVEQYIQNVRKSWKISGCTVKLHLRNREYNDLFEEPDIVGYTVYCPKGVIFLNSYDPSYSSTSNSSFQQLVCKTKKAMEKRTIQILCDVEKKEEKKRILCSYAGLEVYACRLKCSTSICSPTLILDFLQKMCQRCSWICVLLADANNVHRYLTQNMPGSLGPGGVEKLWTPTYEHPFLDLQVVMQHKDKLKSIFLNETTLLSSIINKDKFWEDGKEVLEAVGPLIRILQVFDSFAPNIGYFYEAIKKAEARIVGPNQEKFKVLVDLFDKLKGLIVRPIHVAAAYLNPDYMIKVSENLDFQEGKEHIKESIFISDEGTFETELGKYNRKDQSLFTETAISMLKEYHPVTWWDKFGDDIPVLKRYAIRLLSQPSNCLSHLCHKSKFESLDMLKFNVTMMEEIKASGETELKPIDLCIIDDPLS